MNTHCVRLLQLLYFLWLNPFSYQIVASKKNYLELCLLTHTQKKEKDIDTDKKRVRLSVFKIFASFFSTYMIYFHRLLSYIHNVATKYHSLTWLQDSKSKIPTNILSTKPIKLKNQNK